MLKTRIVRSYLMAKLVILALACIPTAARETRIGLAVLPTVAPETIQESHARKQAGGELEPIRLPAPQTDIGRPLMQVLRDRTSTRDFSSEKLNAQTMSNLL